MAIATPTFTTTEALARLQQAVHAQAADFAAMYSSVLGGIVTDTALMVLPLDDHMVHRGHAVFDTAAIVNGMLYQLEAHLNRFERSASMARIPLPFPRSQMRDIILETAGASGQHDAAVRYWASVGPGGFGLAPGECVGSSFHVMIYAGAKTPASAYTEGMKFITSSIPIKAPFF